MSAASRFSRVSGPTALVVSVFSLVVGLGGVSVAAVSITKNSVGSAQIKNNSITSADVKNNSLTTLDVKDHSLLASDFKAGQLPKGAKGDRGTQGLTGPQGVPGTAEGWAYINSDGSVLDSGGAYPVRSTEVTHPATGSYVITAAGWVETGRGTYPCGTIICFSASFGRAPGVSTESGSTLSFATAAPSSRSIIGPSASGVGVHTFNASGTATDEAFLVWLP